MIGDLFKYWTYQVFSPGTVLREKYEAFRSLLVCDQHAHEGLAELQRICYDALPVEANWFMARYDEFAGSVGCIVDRLEQMCPRCYSDLKAYHTKFDHYIRYLLETPDADRPSAEPYVVALPPTSEPDPGLVGGKAHALIRIVRSLQMSVPRGFVITTNAYRQIIEYNGLEEKIRRHLTRIRPDDPATLAAASDALTPALMESDIPSLLRQSIEDALRKSFPPEKGEIQLAVRSSAVGEDSAFTFAGQYRSCLHVSPGDLMNAYRRVMASKFSPTALYYRIRAGLDDTRTPMAVMVMEMVAPRFSGVLYTRGPTPDKSDTATIHYVPGEGEGLVAGDRQANVIAVPHGRNGPDASGAVRTDIKPESDAAFLNDDAIAVLCQWAQQLEGFMQTPCDVEWCQDRSGRIHLLQCRPLYQQPAPTPELDPPTVDKVSGATVLFSGGICACTGVGSGPIHKISGDDDLQTVPDRGVALLTTAPPHYVPVLDRVSAVIIERGSVAGHFQAVAREFNIPTLVQAENAGTILEHGEEVTVDAGRCEVAAGSLPRTDPTNRNAAPKADLNPLQRRLAAAMDFISPLKLIDPHAPAFTPQSCRSMHDIIRFAHEKAVYEMFSIGDRRLKRKSGARRLIGDLPMVIYVLDVGGGIEKDKARNQTVRIDDLKCRPMHALWKGMLHPEIQWAGHHHFDWAEYDRMVMNGGIISPDSAMLSSYAVVADHYLNFCLKFGYHFAIIDALCQPLQKSGHIWFRFTGGGADARGKMLRVRFTRIILAELGFSVKTEGELINARLQGYEPAMIARRLERIGHLLGVTRLMDMHLKSESQVDRLVTAFFNADFKEFVWEEEEAPDER